MHSKKLSDRARIIVATVLLDNEVARILKQIKDLSEITYEHSLNVAFLTAEILVAKNLCEEEIMAITEGALLHDIGKLHIPRWLLEKRDMLAPDERSEIRKHPQNGVNLLLSEFRVKRKPIVYDIVGMHHERPDSSGYPNGLKDNQIPWYVKLVSTVDAYEAMTADRPYGITYPVDKAINILISELFPIDFILDIENADIK